VNAVAILMRTNSLGDVRLRDGTVVQVRPIEPKDAARLVRFHDALSPESVRLRFFTVHPHLSEGETVRFTTVDHHDREALVALVDDDIIGVGRYERLQGTDEAEVAFVVGDSWQGRGVGSTLLQGLAERARTQGICRFVAQTLAHNHPMLAVFAHSGFPMKRSTSGGVVDVSMTL
jgi:RimJ/RimL family protein N-acetyltransferase